MRKTALEERKRVELRQSFLLYLLSSVSPSGSRYLLPFKHPGTMLDLLPPMTSLWLSDPHNDATRMYCKQLATLWTLARILNSPQSKRDRCMYVYTSSETYSMINRFFVFVAQVSFGPTTTAGRYIDNT